MHQLAVCLSATGVGHTCSVSSFQRGRTQPAPRHSYPPQVAPGEALADEAAAASAPAARRPTGRIAGVIKRNWRQRGYCGSLKPEEGLAASSGAANVLFVPVERRFPMIR